MFLPDRLSYVSFNGTKTLKEEHYEYNYYRLVGNDI